MFPKVLFIISLIIACEVLRVSTFDLKITGTKLDYINGEYVDEKSLSASVVNVNSTYARIPLHWEVIKAFPQDVKLKTRIVRYNSPEDRTGESFIVEIAICDNNDPLHEYLPPFLVELTKSGNCIQPGNYYFYDAGQLQFNKFLIPQYLYGAYSFNTINYIVSPNAYIKKIEISSKPV